MNTSSEKINDKIPDILYSFSFDEGYFINSVVIRAKSFSNAIDQLTLILHESVLEYVQFIHKIN